MKKPKELVLRDKEKKRIKAKILRPGPRASNVFTTNELMTLRKAIKRDGNKKKSEESPGEVAFAKQLDEAGIHYEREVKLIPDRQHRVDFFFSSKKAVVEIEGGVWSQGRHLRGQGWMDDAWKYNTLTAMGYSVYRFATHQVVDIKKNVVVGPVDEALNWLVENGVLRRVL